MRWKWRVWYVDVEDDYGTKFKESDNSFPLAVLAQIDMDRRVELSLLGLPNGAVVTHRVTFRDFEEE